MQTTETSTPFSRHQSWTLLIASLASFKIAMDPLLLAGLGSAMVFPTAIASAVFAAHGSFATSLTFVQGVRPALDALALIGFAGALSALAVKAKNLTVLPPSTAKNPPLEIVR